MIAAGHVSLVGQTLEDGIEQLNLEEQNRHLRDAAPLDIVRWAVALDAPLIASTSFSPNAAVMLHLLVQARPDIPVIWVDSGYNTRDTYLVAEQLIERLDLNIHVYSPRMTAARRDALMGIPMPGDDEQLHREFTRQVKLEPFGRALADFQARIWLSGIRREETDFRKTLDVLSRDHRGILKVAPIFYWSEERIEQYMAEHDLPSCKKYFDPTKVADNRECGLHTGA